MLSCTLHKQWFKNFLLIKLVFNSALFNLAEC